MAIAKRVTIHEIARACGVSVQTVSRVINNRPDVSDSTRESVEKAIADKGYQPSALARGLVKRRSQMLGVIVGGLGNVGVSNILNGIAYEAQSSGYGLLLREINDSGAPDLGPVIDMLTSHQVEGIIFATPATEWTIGLAEEVPENCPPSIFLKRAPSPNHTTIGIDNEEAAKIATNHLISLGRSRIAHITGPSAWLEARQRLTGWQRAMEAAGLTSKRFVVGDWSPESGQAAFRTLLERFPDLDGVFASNDQMALGVLREANLRGIRVPEDVAVVGFDGISEGAFISPTLTTVLQPLEAIGRASVVRLLNEIEGVNDALAGANIVMATELIIRESAPSSTKL